MSWSDQYRHPSFRLWAKAGLGAALYILAAGCQPIPQPFAHPEKTINPIVVPSADFGGVTILPISGLTYERGRSLSAAMADALLSQGIIAGPDSSNRRSTFLQGAVTETGSAGALTRVTIVWDLFDGNGKFLGSREKALALPRDSWSRHDQKSLRDLVKDTAADLAGLVKGESDRSADKSRIALHVGKMKGETGNSLAPLRHAMKAALKKRDFRITDELEGAGLVIAGAVELGPESAEPRPIRITWLVLDTAGKELGKLTQQNSVPRQKLKKVWETLANVIADNAAGGVSDLVVRLPRKVLRRGENPAK